jgi:hypothetical protein
VQAQRAPISQKDAASTRFEKPSLELVVQPVFKESYAAWFLRGRVSCGDEIQGNAVAMTSFPYYIFATLSVTQSFNTSSP